METIDYFSRPVVFFDGECAFCSRFIFRISKENAAGFYFADQRSIHFLNFAKAAGILPDSDGSGSIYLVDAGKLWKESRAILRICLKSNGWYYWLALAAWLIPTAVSNTVYRFIAKRRYLISQFCEMPDKKQISNFLK